MKKNISGGANSDAISITLHQFATLGPLAYLQGYRQRMPYDVSPDSIPHTLFFSNHQAATLHLS